MVDPIALPVRLGMRDFVVRDADEERLRDIAEHYGLAADEIAVDRSGSRTGSRGDS